MSTRLASIGQKGECRIGFTGAIQDLIPTIQTYRKQFPDVGMILKHMTTSQQIEALNKNRLDVGFISVSIKNSKIRVIPIKKMDFYLALLKIIHLYLKNPFVSVI